MIFHNWGPGQMNNSHTSRRKKKARRTTIQLLTLARPAETMATIPAVLGPIHEQYWHAQAYAATQTDNNFHHSTTTQTSHGSQYYSTREQEYAANYRTTTVTSSATPTEVSYNFSTKTGGTEETTESSASLGFGNIQAGAGHLQGVQGGLLGVGGGMNEHWHQNVHLGQEHQPPPESTNASNNWSGSSSNSSA
ncbi:hypothetical protein BJ508DRAFT_114623 [Ascobolus immersus RN42]|uniref:Uncharacterized protein n=1 Tax=Ascobolus immersus RN42 TaxID=1160509 RepID=A0A3N4I5S1_ASCIM|nr:hypothetical protein BJ508DRAFT_114623 [Ascobolus immersus RN42]